MKPYGLKRIRPPTGYCNGDFRKCKKCKSFCDWDTYVITKNNERKKNKIDTRSQMVDATYELKFW